MKFKLRAAAFAVASFVNVQSGSSATVTFGTDSDFDAATTSQVTSGFNGILTPSESAGPGFGNRSSVTVNGTTFTGLPTSGVNINKAGFYGATDLTVDYLLKGEGGVRITLANPVTAFGLDFTTLFHSTTATFALSNGFTTTISNTVAFPTSPEFIGFVSSNPFNSINISLGNSSPNEESLVVQDFTNALNAVAAVPEPTTWAMMMLGFAGLGFMAYRKKKPGLAMAAA